MNDDKKSRINVVANSDHYHHQEQQQHKDQEQLQCHQHGLNMRTIDDFFQQAYNSAAASSPPDGMCRGRIGNFFQSQYALVVIALGTANIGEATEMFTIAYVIADPTFQEDILQNDMRRNGALVAGILSVGLVIGGLLAGSLEHKLGRKPTLLSGLLVCLCSGILCALSPNVTAFAVFRYVLGMGMGAILSSQPALVTELAPPLERGFIVSITQSFWTIGLILNAVSAYLVLGMFRYSWRVFVALSTIPSAIGFLLILWLVPESPRILAIQGEYVAATQSANRISWSMGYRGPPIRVEEIHHHFERERQLRHEHRPSSAGEAARQAIRNLELVYSKDIRSVTVSIQMLWIVISVGTTMATWINTIFQAIHVSNVYLSFLLLNVSCIPGNVASAFLTDRVGRKTFITSALAMAGISLACFAVVVTRSGGSGENAERQIVGFACLYYASLTGVWTTLYLMVAELFPTTVRGTGISVCGAGGRIAGVLAQFVNGALISRPGMLLSVGAGMLFLGVVISLVAPLEEMANRPIHDATAIKRKRSSESPPLDDSRETREMDYFSIERLS